jgi:hypothetical protein
MSLDAAEVRRRLDAAGYDVARIEGLGETLGLDLFSFLAAWSPLVFDQELNQPLPPPLAKPAWWLRLWRWMREQP